LSSNTIPNIKKRYFFKVTRSTIGAGLSVITLPLITRSLGAEQYGIFNYLKIFFEQIIGFFGVFTSAFYPKLSKRPGDLGILHFIVLYDMVLFIVSFFLLVLLFMSGNAETVLTVKSFTIAGSALLLVWLLHINQKMTSFMDALGKTITNEVVLMLMRITLTVGLVLLFVGDRLNLITFLHIQNATLVVFLLILLSFAVKYFSRSEKQSSVKHTAEEFKDYGMPLFWASAVGIVAGLGDRWLLQIFGGATEQGYYSLGFNLGAICFLLTGSFTPLLMREYAIAHEQNNTDRLAFLFSKYLPLFYVITATIACFLTVHGDWLAPLIGGGDFNKAALPVMLLGLAPIHQTFGQLSGSLMTATDRTREYGGISMFHSILGLPVTYFVLAPETYWGLNLGATGLAIKLVVLQVIAVNIQLWYNTRQLGLEMRNLVGHQVLVVMLFLVFATIGKIIVGASFGIGIVALLASGILYFMFVVTIIFIFPSLISMSRLELLNHIKTPSAFLKS
jgi:O-antigen/teichoic acid export membrane protein